MDNMLWGEIRTLGITQSGLISIEFCDPSQCDGNDWSTIYLTMEQVKQISQLGEILNGKTN